MQSVPDSTLLIQSDVNLDHLVFNLVIINTMLGLFPQSFTPEINALKISEHKHSRKRARKSSYT